MGVPICERGGVMENIILNENCLDGILKLKNESVDLIVTDPPYAVGVSSNGAKKHKNTHSSDGYRWRNYDRTNKVKQCINTRLFKYLILDSKVFPYTF